MAIVTQAWASLIAAVIVFFQLLGEAAGYRCYQPRPEIEVMLDAREFENCFKDSGYWDFFLLASFDFIFRVFFISSVLFMSDASIVERASWLALGAIASPSYAVMQLELKSITEVLLFITLACLFFTLLAFFIAAVAVLI